MKGAQALYKAKRKSSSILYLAMRCALIPQRIVNM